MKKLMYLLVLLLVLVSCNKGNSKEAKKLKETIVNRLPEIATDVSKDSLIKYEGEKFRFIYGLDYDNNPATNIRYRGIIYSDKLEKLNYPEGVEIGLDDLKLEEAELYDIANNYRGMLMEIEIATKVENKAKEFFGAKTNLYNDGSMNEEKYKKMTEDRKKKLDFWDKSGYVATIVNVFVDDLDKINNDEMKKKTFELAKFIYNDMNYITSLQVYIRDNKFFENYNLVYGSIYKPFREKEDIKKILKKIKKKEKLTEEEKVMLVKVFNKGLDYDVSHIKTFDTRFKESIELPISIKNIIYQGEIKNGKYIE